MQIEDGILHLVPRGEGEGYHKMERQMLEQERNALRGEYEQKARDRAQTAEWQRQQLEMAKAQEAQASQRRRAEATIKEGMKAPQKVKKPEKRRREGEGGAEEEEVNKHRFGASASPHSWRHAARSSLVLPSRRPRWKS